MTGTCVEDGGRRVQSAPPPTLTWAPPEAPAEALLWVSMPCLLTMQFGSLGSSEEHFSGSEVLSSDPSADRNKMKPLPSHPVPAIRKSE